MIKSLCGVSMESGDVVLSRMCLDIVCGICGIGLIGVVVQCILFVVVVVVVILLLLVLCTGLCDVLESDVL